MRGLAAEGLAVIMISDEIPGVFYHTDRILLMKAGRLHGEFLPLLNSEAAVREAVDAQGVPAHPRVQVACGDLNAVLISTLRLSSIIVSMAMLRRRTCWSAAS